MYDVIVADPPWQYGDRARPRGGTERHYDTLSLAQLAGFKVREHASKDSMLFMWATGPLMPQALHLIESWGASYVTVAFVWVKVTQGPDKTVLKAAREIVQDRGMASELSPLLRRKPRLGGGSYTRANAEYVLLAKWGRGLKSERRDVSQIVMEPRTKCLANYKCDPETLPLHVLLACWKVDAQSYILDYQQMARSMSQASAMRRIALSIECDLAGVECPDGWMGPTAWSGFIQRMREVSFV